MTRRGFEATLGASICLLAIALFVWGIPAWVEQNDFAEIPPDLLPKTATALIAFFGALMAFHRVFLEHDRSRSLGVDARTMGLATAAIGLFAVAVALMNSVGYLVGGAFIVATLMIFMGSRQWLLIGSVAAGAPLLLYAFFELLLGVPLP